METYARSEQSQQIPQGRKIQNGDTRNNPDLPTDRGVDHVHRFQRLLLSYTHTKPIRKYLRFHVQGKTYQFKALPFGLSTAPLEFTVVTKEVKLMTLQKGIRIHQYLDDWLVRARCNQTCLQHTQTLVALCQDLGWLVNMDKSKLEPKKVFDFVGYQFDLKEGKVRLILDRWRTQTTNLPSLATHVPHRAVNNRNQTKWDGPRINRKGDTSPQVAPPPPKLVA